MAWLNGYDALDSIDELLMNGHAVFNGEAPRPMRIPEEIVLPSQYSDGSDVEDEGPCRPKLHHISEMLRKLEKRGSGDHLSNPINFETSGATKDFEVMLTKSNLNPQVLEFIPNTKRSSAETTNKSDVDCARTESESVQFNPPDVLKTNITARRQAPRQRNTAVESLLKLRALHNKAGGDVHAVQLLRPEDFLKPLPSVEMVSEPLASLPEPSTTFAESPATPPSTAGLGPRDLTLDAEEKVARWFDDKETPNKDLPTKPTPELSLSKTLMFMPKVSPASSGLGSPASPATPASGSPAPLRLQHSTAVPASRPARRGPTPYVPSVKATALYEEYNRNKRLKECAQPNHLESHLQNTVWAAVSKELVENQLKKQAMTDAA